MPFLNEHVFFIHIPKTAGVSIVKYASKFSGGVYQHSVLDEFSQKLLLAIDSNRNVVDSFQLVTQHFTLSDLISLNLLKRDSVLDGTTIIFTVFRDPFERFYSAFQSHERVLRYKSLNNFVDQGLRRFGELSDHELWAHLRPQVDFIRSDLSPDIIPVVLDFANLKHDLDMFMSGFGNEGKWDFPFEGHNIKSRNIDIRNLLSSENRNFVEKHFGNDIEFYQRLKKRRRSGRVRI